jgi:hypothetical protein
MIAVERLEDLDQAQLDLETEKSVGFRFGKTRRLPIEGCDGR